MFRIGTHLTGIAFVSLISLSTSWYYTAGPDGEQHGLFSTITAVENLLGGDL